MDVVVVGAGTAGCVVAARNSASADHHVTLLEAGPDYAPEAELPADVADASRPTVAHDWGFTAERDGDRVNSALPRAKLVGGCSATNAVFFLRGWPHDYDTWATAGNPGWGYEDLLPVLRAVEADADFGGPEHGIDGPVPVSRIAANALPPWPRAFLDAAVTRGHREIGDHNAAGAVGVGPVPRNVRDGTRMSTALTHLAPARRRLEVRPGATVDRVVHQRGRARGVRLLDGDELAADVVVLCAGTYGTPAILLRSGIGPRADLERLGVRCAVELPGVGANLVDHPLVAIDLPATPGHPGPAFPVLLTLHSSSASAGDPPDLHLFPAGPFDDPAAPSGATFAILTGLLAPRSRGSVRLRSPDPNDPPRIDPAHLRAPEDLLTLLEGLREARRIAATPPLADLLPGPEIHPGSAVDHEDLADWLRRHVGTYHHPVGTCAMGPDPAAGAVTDHHGAVHGVHNLYIADASVMPTIPSANTNLTTIVVAEHLADLLLHEPRPA